MGQFVTHDLFPPRSRGGPKQEGHSDKRCGWRAHFEMTWQFSRRWPWLPARPRKMPCRSPRRRQGWQTSYHAFASFGSQPALADACVMMLEMHPGSDMSKADEACALGVHGCCSKCLSVVRGSAVNKPLTFLLKLRLSNRS